MPGELKPSSRRARKHELIADQLRRQILAGQLVPGDRLPTEDQLMPDFGIARNTLREALRVLESQGLVRVLRGRNGGPVVTYPDLAPTSAALATTLQLRHTTVDHLDTARRLLEPQLVGWLAKHHDDADIDALNAAINAARLAADRNDFDAFASAAVGVHETLIERSRNNTLSVLSLLLHEMVQGYYERHSVDQATMRRAIRSYRRLVSLVEAGRADEAIAHWEAQMTYTMSGHDPNEPITVAARPNGLRRAAPRRRKSPDTALVARRPRR